jgi:hypothetical protein
MMFSRSRRARRSTAPNTPSGDPACLPFFCSTVKGVVNLDSAQWGMETERARVSACRPRNGPSSDFRLLLCFLVLSALVPAGRGAPRPNGPGVNGAESREANCKIVYLGVVGALELANNSRSGVVQIRETLNQHAYPDVCARTFSPYVWRSGLHYVLQHFPSHPGLLTQQELDSAPKVILVGHSMGGWAVVSVARQLKNKGIPVELSIQVDSVGITDQTKSRCHLPCPGYPDVHDHQKASS